MPACDDPIVAISALTLVPGQIGGTERYVRELISALSGTPTARPLHLLVPPSAPELAGAVPGTVVSGYGAPRSTVARAAAMLRYARRQPDRLAGRPIAAIHYPLTTRVPAAAERPSAASVHDVQHLVHPERFSALERAYRARYYDGAIRESDLLITISEHAARTLEEHRGVSRERIRVIPLGVDLDRFRSGANRERRNMLLYPARPWPHKNHALLFESFRIVRAAEPELELVLTGAGTEALPPEPGVVALGRVGDDDLARLYSEARAMVFPSLYEGFGMPIIEALASGCPVACSDTTSIPEVGGHFATYFDPTSSESIAAGILTCLGGASPERAQAGRAWAEGFSWARTAALHADVYAELRALCPR